MKKRRPPEFEERIRRLGSRNPALLEAAFDSLSSRAGELVHQLIDAYRKATDHRLRCSLLELIGDAPGDAALPLLSEELHSGSESLRDWARRGLERLDTREARRALFEFDRGSRAPLAP